MLADIILGIPSNDIIADSDLGLFITTAISVIIAAILVFLTWKNVKASTKLVEMQSNPFVYIAPELPEQPRNFYIVIKNTGGSVARDVKFVDVTGDFSIQTIVEADQSTSKPDKTQKTPFKQLPIIKNGIKELAPGQIIRLVQLQRGDVSNIKNSVKITFEYKNIIGETKKESNIIDFPAYAHSFEQS